MLVHIDESAVREATGEGDTAEKAQDCIETLLIAHLEGNHVISLRPEDVALLSPLPWSRRARRALQHIDENFAQIGGLREEVAWSVEVGSGHDFNGGVVEFEGRRVIRLDLRAFDQTRKAACTVLVGENPTDARLFVELGRMMLATRRWENVDLIHERRGGGGDTTHIEFASAADLGRIVLAIADTDQAHPSSRMGETYAKLEEAARGRPAHQQARRLHVRTAEGLVPLEVYRELFESSPERLGCVTRIEQFLHSTPAEILRYAHLKNGIRLHQVEYPKTEAEGEYWLEIAKKTKRDRCNRSPSEACTRREECKCYVVDALGSKALEDVVVWLEKQRAKRTLAKRFGLTKNAQTELALLADEILAWGLAFGTVQT